MKKYILKLRFIIIIKVFTDSLYVASIASIPYIIKMLIDYDFSKGSKDIIILVLLYLMAAIVGMGFQYISQLYAWKLTKNFNLLIKKDIFASILNYDYIKFKENNLSTYISILNNDVKVMEEYVQGFISILQSSIQIIIYGIYIFTLNPIIAAVIISASLLMLFLPNVTTKTLAKRRNIHLHAVAEYIGKFTDLLEGFKNVNYKTIENIAREHDDILQQTENKLLHYGKSSTFTNVFNGICMYLLDISAFIAVAVLLLRHSISIGIAVATLSYIKEFVYPIRYLIDDLTKIKSTKYINEKLYSYINQSKKNLPIVKEFKSSIEFSNVSVKFDKFQINNFNYKFEKGKKYAIIGHSGSGKSTIINLLMKYLERTTGKILVDGIDINDVDINSAICCVNQFEHVFSDDFSNNVTVYGAYSDSKIHEIINYSECDKINLIKSNEDCSKLSGGEKQLLSLVKMMLINKDIIILDEHFSALDIQNTLLMQNKIYGLEDKTMIVVTHNLSESNLRFFDEVIIMNNGFIEKSGVTPYMIESLEYNNLVKSIA